MEGIRKQKAKSEGYLRWVVLNTRPTAFSDSGYTVLYCRSVCRCKCRRLSTEVVDAMGTPTPSATLQMLLVLHLLSGNIASPSLQPARGSATLPILRGGHGIGSGGGGGGGGLSVVRRRQPAVGGQHAAVQFAEGETRHCGGRRERRDPWSVLCKMA